MSRCTRWCLCQGVPPLVSSSAGCPDSDATVGRSTPGSPGAPSNGPLIALIACIGQRAGRSRGRGVAFIGPLQWPVEGVRVVGRWRDELMRSGGSGVARWQRGRCGGRRSDEAPTDKNGRASARSSEHRGRVAPRQVLKARRQVGTQASGRACLPSASEWAATVASDRPRTTPRAQHTGHGRL